MAASLETNNEFKDYQEKHVYDITPCVKACQEYDESWEEDHMYWYGVGDMIKENQSIEKAGQVPDGLDFCYLGFYGTMVDFLPQIMDLFRTAQLFNGVPYGGFIRGFVEYLFNDPIDDSGKSRFCQYTRLSGDIDLWFRSSEKAESFIDALKKVEKAMGWKVYDASFSSEDNEEAYGFATRTYNIGVPFIYHGQNGKTTGILTAFSIDVVISKDDIPISDASINCLGYDITTGKFESYHPYYTAQDLIDQILKKELRLIQPDTFGHDLFLYSNLINKVGTLKALSVIKKEFPETSRYGDNLAEYKWKRLRDKFLKRGWKIVA